MLALAQAAAKLPHINFKIVGDGPERQKLENFIAKNWLINIELPGAKSREEILQLMAKARLFVLPSVWYENYSIALLEASAIGKAIIASRTGGNAEIIEDGRTGFLVTPNNLDELAAKIDRLYNNQELISKLGQAAKQKILQDNNPETHYQKLMDIYQQAIAKTQ